MLFKALKTIFSRDKKVINSYKKIVAKINQLEPDISVLSDEKLREKTDYFKQELKQGKTLDDILPEAFAVVREAAKRTVQMRHYDVQLLGGIALHNGFVSEMKTGEGKTLVATLPAYLNALEGKGVHVITVNDYLSERDHEWMGKVYRFLGLSTGFVSQSHNKQNKNEIYKKDIVYVTNTEAGFDYLRDNLQLNKKDLSIISRPLNYAIIDEIDSILIDESRTPLIISGPSKTNTALYKKIYGVVKSKLSKDCYEIDEKNNNVTLTEKGNEVLEVELKSVGIIPSAESIYSANSYEVLNQCIQALKAEHTLTRDSDYIVKNGQVMLVDEFTGRIMEGRRYSKGLHQALEAKEGLKIHPESTTIASITYQNFFRLYNKISGMTGTAKTEEKEFFDIYKLKVLSIPTHKKILRKDFDDLIFKSKADKANKILELVQEKHAKGQPILIGTSSIASSEELSRMLKKNKISHQVLNAKKHELEASIIAQAGRLNAVTIATNMAGRGTDIILGGNIEAERAAIMKSDQESKEDLIKELEERHELERESVVKANGLCVIGSERHESRRIDDQLRGRSGRLGDVGESIFLLSLQDDLIRIFGGDTMEKMFSKMGFKEGESLNHPMLNNAVSRSQKKLEGLNYDSRKSLLQYDDIINEQRKVFYQQRQEFVNNPDDIFNNYKSIINKVSYKIATNSISSSGVMEIDLLNKGISHYVTGEDKEALLNILKHNIEESTESAPIAVVERMITSFIHNITIARLKNVMPEDQIDIIKDLIISAFDQSWQEHISTLSHLKEGIHLRSYGQKDPLGEFKRDSYDMFEMMFETFEESLVKRMVNIRIQFQDPDLKGVDLTKVKRNDPCPCGSNKKFKQCHGSNYR